MTRLHLVRHGPTTVDPTRPQDQWRLSEEGREVVQNWAESQSWPGVRHLYASPEVKAMETAAIIAAAAHIPVGTSEGLRELRVPLMASRAEFLNRMEQYLAGFADPAFEPWEAAQERMGSAIRAIQARHADESIAVVSHGRILTAYLSGLLHRRLTHREWQAIGMPDVAVVDLETGHLVRGFAGWEAARP